MRSCDAHKRLGMFTGCVLLCVSDVQKSTQPAADGILIIDLLLLGGVVYFLSCWGHIVPQVRWLITLILACLVIKANPLLISFLVRYTQEMLCV